MLSLIFLCKVREELTVPKWSVIYYVLWNSGVSEELTLSRSKQLDALNEPKLHCCLFKVRRLHEKLVREHSYFIPIA